MQEGSVTLDNRSGMHARVVSEFISFVNRYKCSVSFVKKDQIANAKSILNVLTMGINSGETVIVRTDGIDEDRALREVIEYIKNIKE